MPRTIDVDVSVAATQGKSMGKTEAKTGDTIIFKASQKRTMFAIPKADELFGKVWGLAFTVERGGKSEPYTVTKDVKKGDAPVAYHYAVFCDGAADFAEGTASSPILIIGPPED